MSLMTVPIAPSQVTFCAFSDASFLSGREKFAHQGGLIFATTPELLENRRAVVAPVAWISKKIHRVTRSTLGAEAIALKWHCRSFALDSSLMGVAAKPRNKLG